MAFTIRTTESGIYDSSFWYNSSINPGAQNYIWLPNCTTYAYGRTAEICSEKGHPINSSTLFGGGFRNAVNWYNEALWDKSTSKYAIKEGDILVFGAGGAVSSMGHVSVVEWIDGDNIYVTQSNWQQDYQVKDYPAFQAVRCFEYGYWNRSTGIYRQIYHNPGTIGTNYTSLNLSNFLGCIHNPYVDEPTPPVRKDPVLSIAPTSKSLEIGRQGASFDISIDLNYSNPTDGYPTITVVTITPGIYIKMQEYSYSDFSEEGFNYRRTRVIATTTISYKVPNLHPVINVSWGSLSRNCQISITKLKIKGIMFSYDGTNIFIR